MYVCLFFCIKVFMSCILFSVIAELLLVDLSSVERCGVEGFLKTQENLLRANSRDMGLLLAHHLGAVGHDHIAACAVTNKICQKFEDLQVFNTCYQLAIRVLKTLH